MSEGQTENPCRRLVSLAFHGALPEHLLAASVLPASVRATFFLDPEGVLKDPRSWQQLAARGHEIGNGCLYGVTEDGRVPNWTLRMVEQEIHMAQEFLRDVFQNQEPVSFCYPGRHTLCANGDYRTVVEPQFMNCVTRDQGLNEPGCNPDRLLMSSRPEDGGWSILVLETLGEAEQAVLGDLVAAGQWEFLPVREAADACAATC